MEFNKVTDSAPGIGLRVLVKTQEGWQVFATRQRNTPCEGTHWLSDRGTIVRGVTGWTWVNGRMETE